MKSPRAFASNIYFGQDCHEWMSSKNQKGYGLYFDPATRKLIAAHRYAYKMVNGPIPPGLQVCHKCDNPRCVRHDHLFLGDNSVNQKDSVSKGRHASTKKTHCPRGHLYTPENTYVRTSAGSRECVKCKYNPELTKKQNASTQSV